MIDRGKYLLAEVTASRKTNTAADLDDDGLSSSALQCHLNDSEVERKSIWHIRDDVARLASVKRKYVPHRLVFMEQYGGRGLCHTRICSELSCCRSRALSDFHYTYPVGSKCWRVWPERGIHLWFDPLLSSAIQELVIYFLSNSKYAEITEIILDII